MESVDISYIRSLGALNRVLSALKVLNCSCDEAFWPVFPKYCKIAQAEDVFKDVVLSSFDWEGYRQRLDIAVTLNRYKETICECNIASDKYELFIEDMIGRDGERVNRDLSSALSNFGQKIKSPKNCHLSTSDYQAWWHFCSARHCILDGRCMFFIAEDLLPILSVPDSGMGFIGRRLKNSKCTFEEALIPFLIDNYKESGWPTFFRPCIASHNHEDLPDDHLAEVNIEISAAVLTYLFRSESISRFAGGLLKSIDQIVVDWLDNLKRCRIDGDESLFFSWYTHPSKPKDSIKNETISATISIGISLFSLLLPSNKRHFSSDTAIKISNTLKDIIAFVIEKTDGLTRSKPLYSWSSGRDSYLAEIPVTDIKPIMMAMEFFLDLLCTPTVKVYEYSEGRKIDAVVSNLADLLVSTVLDSGLWPVLDNKEKYLYNPLFANFSPNEWEIEKKPNLSIGNSIDALSVLARYLDRRRIQYGRSFGKQIEERGCVIICMDLSDSTKYKHHLPSIENWGPISHQLTWMREWLDNYSPVYLNFTGDGYLALIRSDDAAVDEMTGEGKMSIEYLVARLGELRSRYLDEVFKRKSYDRTWATHETSRKEIEAVENVLCARVSLHINVDKLYPLRDQYIGPDLDLCCRLNNPELGGTKGDDKKIRSIPNPVFVSGLLVDTKSQFADRVEHLGRMEAKGIEFSGAQGSGWHERFKDVFLYK